jgi:hypothetical protein
MKPVNFKNKINGDCVVCENVKDIHTIDGVEYLLVHRLDQTRTFLMRKEVLEKVQEKIDKVR